MIIRDITIKELPAYSKSSLFTGSKIIPITPERIISQVNNPRAQPDDIVLIVAYTDNGKLAGFVGMIPDNGNSAAGPYRYAWSSCWWVDPELGKGIALKLFYRSIQVWHGSYMIADLTPHTRRIIDYTRLFYFSRPSKGIRLQVFSDFSGKLTRKYKFPAFFIWLIQLFDKALNQIFLYRLIKWKRNNKKEGLIIEYMESPDSDSLSFIDNHNQDELSRRGKSEFSWILSYPWLKQSRSVRHDVTYPFSWECRHFEFLVAKIRYREAIVAVVVLSNRDGNFKIPYACYEPSLINMFACAVGEILIDKKACSFFTFRSGLSECIKKIAFPFFYKRTVVSALAVCKNIADKQPEKFILQDGDGDAVFT